MNQQANAKRSFPYVGLILWVTLALVVLILGYTFVDSLGIIGRLDNAAKSDNIKLNEKELDIYRYHVAQNQLYTEFMYYQYGLMHDPHGWGEGQECDGKWGNNGAFDIIKLADNKLPADTSRR